MSYRADGLRTEKQNTEGTSRFVWDGQALLLETGTGGTTEVQYTLEPGSFGSLVRQRGDGATRIHLFDALGSTRQLIDAAQQVTDSYVYRAYGSLASATGDSENPHALRRPARLLLRRHPGTILHQGQALPGGPGTVVECGSAGTWRGLP